LLLAEHLEAADLAAEEREVLELLSLVELKLQLNQELLIL
jgi:hypothetical protein